jgi:L-ascorbate metabolism protein UlaG (beta-lactamase superfamily)
MKKIIQAFLYITFIFSVYQLSAQRATADKIATDKGDLIIQPILHGTLVLTWNGTTIYVDPYGGAEKFAGLAEPDLILITDIHGDHHDQKTLDALKTSSAVFIVPQAVMDKLPAEMQAQSQVVANGNTVDISGFSIEAIPMYNMPDDETSRHTKGRGNGYILTMGGKRIYISGDTEDIPEMRSLTAIDVAFVCMNLPYTMDVNQAVSAVSEFKPAIVYPYHYRGQGGLSDVEAFKSQVEAGSQGVEVRLRNWYGE